MPALTGLAAAPAASLSAPASSESPAGATAAVPVPAPTPIDEDLAHLDTRLWNPVHQHRAFELGGGPFVWRRVGSSARDGAAGLAGGAGTLTSVRPGPFVLSWGSGFELREFDGASFALSYVQYVSGGLSLGPLEPEVRAAFSIATVDVFHGSWSAEMLSPAVSAGAWLRLGHLRIGAHAFGEYLWRWFGNPDVLLHGGLVVLQIGS